VWNEHMQMLQNRHIIFLFIKIIIGKLIFHFHLFVLKIEMKFPTIVFSTNINIFQWKGKNGKVVCKLYTYTHIIYKIYKVFYIYTCIKYMKYYHFIKKLYKQFYNAERACLVCSILSIQRLNESVYVRETLLIKNNYS